MSKPSTSFAGDVLKLMTGNVFAQSLGILVAPILTRLFAPEAFGIAALFSSITAIFGVVACLRYELSIMLPKTDEEATNLLGVSILSVLAITAIAALTIFVAKGPIVRLLNAPELSKYIWLIPPAVLISGVFLALNYWNSRTKNFGQLSIARVVSSVSTNVAKLGAGFAGFVSGGVLIGASIIGQFVSTSILGSQIWRDDRSLFKESIRWKKMIAEVKRHKKFPIYSTWSALLNTTSQQLPIWILAFYFLPTVVGFYALGMAVLSLPMNLLGSAIAQVFFQKAVETHNRTNDLPRVVEELFKRLVSLSIFPILLLTIVGKDVFIVAFGARWAEAGVYVQILALWIFFRFISSPISTLFSVLEKQGSALLFNGILLVIRATSLIIGGMSGDIRFTLLLFASTGVVCYGFLCFWLLSSAKVPLNRALYYLNKCAVYCLPMLGITVLAKWGFGLNPLGVSLIGFLGAIPYYVIILKQDSDLRIPVQILLKRFGFIR